MGGLPLRIENWSESELLVLERLVTLVAPLLGRPLTRDWRWSSKEERVRNKKEKSGDKKKKLLSRDQSPAPFVSL